MAKFVINVTPKTNVNKLSVFEVPDSELGGMN